jgi:hypothetical protein
MHKVSSANPIHRAFLAMRTTLTIDDDVLSAARHLAERDQKTLGDVISALARQALSRSGQEPAAQRNGIPLLVSRPQAGRSQASVPITLELVNELRDELP